MIKLVNTIDQIEQIREIWQKLLDDSPNVTPFQSVDYVIASWSTMNSNGCKLFVVCYYNPRNNLLQAIFPWYIDVNHTLRYINDTHTDFCGAIVHKEVVGDYHLWEDVVDSIKNESDIKRVCLDNLSVTSVSIDYFRLFLCPSVVYCKNAYSVLSIDKKQEGHSFIYALNLSNAIDRNRIKKMVNKMEDVELNVYTSPQPYPMSSIASLMDSMLKQGIREAVYFNEVRGLIEKLYDAGLIYIYITSKNGSLLAANVFLKNKVDDIYYNWLVFYEDRQFNLWSLLQSIESISEEGGCLNFCRGTYEYKIRNFRPRVHNLYTLRWSRHIPGQLQDIWSILYYQLRQVAKKIIKG